MPHDGERHTHRMSETELELYQEEEAYKFEEARSGYQRRDYHRAARERHNRGPRMPFGASGPGTTRGGPASQIGAE